MGSRNRSVDLPTMPMFAYFICFLFSFSITFLFLSPAKEDGGGGEGVKLKGGLSIESSFSFAAKLEIFVVVFGGCNMLDRFGGLRVVAFSIVLGGGLFFGL